MNEGNLGRGGRWGTSTLALYIRIQPEQSATDDGHIRIMKMVTYDKMVMYEEEDWGVYSGGERDCDVPPLVRQHLILREKETK